MAVTACIQATVMAAKQRFYQLPHYQLQNYLIYMDFLRKPSNCLWKLGECPQLAKMNK